MVEVLIIGKTSYLESLGPTCGYGRGLFGHHRQNPNNFSEVERRPCPPNLEIHSQIDTLWNRAELACDKRR